MGFLSSSRFFIIDGCREMDSVLRPGIAICGPARREEAVVELGVYAPDAGVEAREVVVDGV